MDAIDCIRDHFNSLALKRIEVPEWNLTIFSTPMTLSEKNKLYKKSQSNDMELLADVLIMKATDEAGNKLFTIENRVTLLNKAEPSIIARVANVILDSSTPNSEELKN